MSLSEFSVKPATPEDVPDLLAMVLELAIYEKEPDAVVATPEMMIKAIFEDKYAEAMIVRKKSDNSAVAMCIYFFTYSTWLGVPGLYVEDIYVKPEYRANGLGKLLFGFVGEIALQRNCARVEWRVLKWNTPSINFYEKRLGAAPQSEWEMERLEGAEGIQKLADLKKEFVQ